MGNMLLAIVVGLSVALLTATSLMQGVLIYILVGMATLVTAFMWKCLPPSQELSLKPYKGVPKVKS